MRGQVIGDSKNKNERFIADEPDYEGVTGMQLTVIG